MFEIFNESLRDGDQSLLGPGQEPIDGAFVEKSREFTSSVREFLAHGGEAENNMEIVSSTFDEVVPKFVGCGVNVSEVFEFNIFVSNVRENDFFFILSEETGNFSCTQYHVDEFQEFFLLHFRISH